MHDRFETFGHLAHAIAMLEWDQFVMMPPGAERAHTDASATLKQLAHGCVAAAEIGDLVDAARAEDLDPWQAANVRERVLPRIR